MRSVERLEGARHRVGQGPHEAAADEEDRETALKEYIPEYKDRFPEGANLKEVLRVRDRIEMAEAEDEIESDLRMGRQPDDEAGRKFVEAGEYETKFDDQVTTLQQFEALVKLFEGREEDRPYVNLARREIRRLRKSISEGGGSKSAIEVVWNALRKADALYANGRGSPDDDLEAKDLWRSVIQLYGKKSELKRYIDYASARLNKEELPPIDFSKPPFETKNSN